MFTERHALAASGWLPAHGYAAAHSTRTRTHAVALCLFEQANLFRDTRNKFAVVQHLKALPRTQRFLVFVHEHAKDIELDCASGLALAACGQSGKAASVVNLWRKLGPLRF